MLLRERQLGYLETLNKVDRTVTLPRRRCAARTKTVRSCRVRPSVRTSSARTSARKFSMPAHLAAARILVALRKPVLAARQSLLIVPAGRRHANRTTLVTLKLASAPQKEDARSVRHPEATSARKSVIYQVSSFGDYRENRCAYKPFVVVLELTDYARQCAKTCKICCETVEHGCEDNPGESGKHLAMIN